MGKIIKYCAVCEESFAERFSFCPNCAADLQTFEMNPVLSKKEFEDSIKQFEGKVISEKEFYNVTFVEGKGSTKRRSLLLGATLLVMGGAVFSLIGSIYNADAYVGALEDSLVYVSSISEDDPYKIEEPDLPQDKDHGGGGSGGNKDPNPVSKGVLASQSEKPLIAPSVTMTKVTDPAIKVRMETKGVVKREPTDQPYGDENSKYDVLSDGDGENGGQGNGRDRGQGPGKGPGGGPGSGPGYGPGPGGPGIPQKNPPKIDPDETEPPQMPKGVTTALKITEKPRAIYTQEARKNQTSGTVTLRVTFMANGSIGNIAVVSGLPDGLTEQAIAAARNIQFEPAKRNGVAQTVTKQVQYTFTLY
jgi:TonB family protein